MGRHHEESHGVVQSFVLDIDDSSASTGVGILPANAMLLKTIVSVTTGYGAGASIEIGTLIVPNLYSDKAIDLLTTGFKEENHGQIVGGDTEIAVSINGGAGGGAARVLVQYIVGP